MKIAIASEGKEMKDLVCPTAGRAPYYLIIENDEIIKTIKNPFAVGGGGAGFGVAQMLADENVDLVVAGKLGGNMIGSLKENNIGYLEMENLSVEEALNKAKESKPE